MESASLNSSVTRGIKRAGSWEASGVMLPLVFVLENLLVDGDWCSAGELAAGDAMPGFPAAEAGGAAADMAG